MCFFFITIPISYAETSAPPEPSAKYSNLLEHIGEQIRYRFHQIWYDGSIEGYGTGYAWHNRYTYTPERIQTHHYNELAWGGGLGKGFFDEDGDWHGLYAMAFLDSHKNVQPIAGYGFVKMIHFKYDFNAGVGFTLFVTERSDIFHGIPFPGIPLPLVTVGYNRFNIVATYIPGGRNVGNVLFVFGKWTF